MRGVTWKFGLPVRFAATVGLISFIAALIVSIPTFLYARSYLLEQRETSATSRALVDANAVEVALSDGEPPNEALSAVPTVGDSQPMLEVNDEWFTNGVTVSPDDLPPDLLSSAATNDGSMQRFTLENGDLYLAIAIPVPGGMYVEVFPLVELDAAITSLSFLLAVGSLAALVAGAGLGGWAGARILRPLRDMAEVATRITEGDLSARVIDSHDPDLGPIATAFNNMAATVESRLERERRFSANVSHELRSPLTGILGTAELLESRKDELTAREATLVLALVSQVRRFSTLVLDLLELSQIGGDRDVLPDMVDVAALARFVVAERDRPRWMVRGEATARTDARRLERILANLVDNADKHGEGLRAVRVDRADARTEIFIDDRGPGIPEEDRQRIFEPFNRGSKTDRLGSGLGLAIVAEQARLIGGTVTIEDAPGGGARFVVSFRDLPMWEEVSPWRRLMLVVLAAACLFLVSCGIPADDEPRPLPTGEATPEPPPNPTDTPSPLPQRVTLWFVRESQLAPAERATTGPVDSQDFIDLLATGPTQDEKDAGFRSAVVSVVSGQPLVVTADAASVEVSGVGAGQVAIVLEPEFRDLLSDEQIRVLGQVVTTVAVGEVHEVIFVDEDGLRLGVPLADGRLRNGPVTPADYAELIG